MSNRLETIVNEELREHEKKSKAVDSIHESLDRPGIPTVERRDK
jgi:hypothetical protein